MRKLNYYSFFNKNSVNIFTDAAVTMMSTEFIVCSAAHVYYNDIFIDMKSQIMYNSTVNRGELTAILMGVIEANKYKDRVTNINLFSDSQTSVFGIRDRIFRWANNARNGYMYGGDNNIIQNQDCVMNIVNYILDYNININIFHIKGHIESHKSEQLNRAKGVFIASNFQKDTIVDNPLVAKISDCNCQVDKYAKYMLQSLYNPQEHTKNPGMINAVEIRYYNFDKERYRSLLNNKK